MATAKTKLPTKKPKLVRDSFTIPKNEYAAIDALKERAVTMGTSVKKSELLRAGLMALLAMGDPAYRRALAAVPTLKTGRPSAVADTPVAEALPAPKLARPARKPAAKAAAKSTAKATPNAAVSTTAKAPMKPSPAPAKAPTKRAPVKRTAAKTSA